MNLKLVKERGLNWKLINRPCQNQFSELTQTQNLQNKSKSGIGFFGQRKDPFFLPTIGYSLIIKINIGKENDLKHIP